MNLHSTQAQDDAHSKLPSQRHLQVPSNDDGNRQHHNIREQIQRGSRNVERTLGNALATRDRHIVNIVDWVALEDIDKEHGDEKQDDKGHSAPD